MTSDEFATASIALLRSAVGWQSAIARRLDVESRTVRRWLAAGETPGWVDLRIAELMGRTQPGSWPRDEWMIGQGVAADGHAREYLVHLVAPRFVGRIVACDGDGAPEAAEHPVDVISGFTYQIDPETVLCEIDWIDAPDTGQIPSLLAAVGEAIEEMGARAGTRPRQHGD